MLKDIEVKIIAPAQLPPVLYWLLNHKYHTEQWDFVVMFDAKWQILYVNRTSPLAMAEWIEIGVCQTAYRWRSSPLAMAEWIEIWGSTARI